MSQATEEEYADCGLDGRAEDSVKIGDFNKLLRRIGVFHLRPIKKASQTMQDHVEECAKLQAQIAGGILVIKWMIGICTTVVVALLIALLSKKFGL